MNSVLQWLKQLQLEPVLDIAVVVAASLVCIAIHESSHGFVAWKLGDDTAKRQGRLSWNPLRHIDIMGLVMMAIFRFGWAKAVPVNPNHFRHPKAGMALTAAAGPLSNVFLALVAGLLRCFALIGLLKWNNDFWAYLELFLHYIIILSAGLAVFNLFPIPPLDGSKILFGVLPDRWYAVLLRYERFGMLLLMGLLFFDVLDRPLVFLRDRIISVIDTVAVPLFSFLAAHLL